MRSYVQALLWLKLEVGIFVKFVAVFFSHGL